MKSNPWNQEAPTVSHKQFQWSLLFQRLNIRCLQILKWSTRFVYKHCAWWLLSHTFQYSEEPTSSWKTFLFQLSSSSVFPLEPSENPSKNFLRISNDHFVPKASNSTGGSKCSSFAGGVCRLSVFLECNLWFDFGWLEKFFRFVHFGVFFSWRSTDLLEIPRRGGDPREIHSVYTSKFRSSTGPVYKTSDAMSNLLLRRSLL